MMHAPHSFSLPDRAVTVQRAQPWLGTLVAIAAQGESATVHTAIDRAFKRISDIQACMSWHNPASELSHVNRSAHRDWIELSPDLAAVLQASLDMARLSDGLFDPTVAPLLCESGLLPRHDPLDAHKAASVWQAIELDANRVRFAQPLAIDLGGIAKGYAVDAALAELSDAGLVSASVNAGGDLARFGPHAEAIQVRHPASPTHALHLLDLQNGAAATSAGYYQSHTHQGQPVGPLRHPLTHASLCLEDSVTVVAPTCMLADALTKVVAADLAGAPARLAAMGAQAIHLGMHHHTLRIAMTDTQRAVWTQRPLNEAAA